MKIQALAVISIIIILPMTILLNSYTANQMKTLDLQVSYDSKLMSATQDAIRAFQLNMSNSSTSDLANSKMRDIEASINTFYNSLGSNFNMAGYGENVLQNYVPAVVYTLYDGYYIYSAYNNTLDKDDTLAANAKYKDTEKIYGLKPYIYYSCRYKRDNSFDIVITYSLDSYITIQGTIKSGDNPNLAVNKSGYLLSGVDKYNGQYRYNKIKIEEETGLKQYVYEPKVYDGEYVVSEGTNLFGSIINLPCRKVNGVKYYEGNNSVFAIINDNKIDQNTSDVAPNTIEKNTNAKNYYKEAYEFKEWIKNNLKNFNISSDDAVDEKGNKLEGIFPQKRFIFNELFNDDDNKKDIEDEDSEFNVHKTEVIKYVIEKNLKTAISNYNTYSTAGVNFSMPKLSDSEWEQITKNISMVSFLQGLTIGGKIYNGYSIVQNSINDDYVSEDSIYISDKNMYYKVNDESLFKDGSISNFAVGFVNTDFERKTSLASYKNETDGIDISKNIYYYPRKELASYSSIIEPGKSENPLKFLKNKLKDEPDKYSKLAEVYYTALGRERYGMYRVNNEYTKIQEILRTEGK